jgi:hypothetical protein
MRSLFSIALLKLVMIVTIAVGAMLFVGRHFDEWRALTPDQKEIVNRFYSPDDVRSCHLRIKKIRYSEHISGTIGFYGADHEPSLVFLNEQSPPVADDPYVATPIISRRWYDGIELIDPDYLKVSPDAANLADHRVRINIKGWIVNGENSCLSKHGWRDDRFIFSLDSGKVAGVSRTELR